MIYLHALRFNIIIELNFVVRLNVQLTMRICPQERSQIFVKSLGRVEKHKLERVFSRGFNRSVSHCRKTLKLKQLIRGKVLIQQTAAVASTSASYFERKEYERELNDNPDYADVEQI